MKRVMKAACIAVAAMALTAASTTQAQARRGFAGPNGGTFKGANAGAYKKGVGGARASQFSSQGPNGGSASGYSNNVYNAQTGTGARNSGKDFNTASGQSYGYDGSTSYTKGSGATSTIDTQNKGDYTVDWQKGTKPVVTSVPATP